MNRGPVSVSKMWNDVGEKYLGNSLVATQTTLLATMGRPLSLWVAFGDRVTIFRQHFLSVLFFYASAFRRRRHYVFGLSVRPSEAWNTLFWPVHGSVGPPDQPWPFYSMSVRPSVRPSVWRGFRAFAGEHMEGMAWNFTCWCILTTFRTD